MHKCKITVVKISLNQDLIDKYFLEEYKSISICDQFTEGQEFIIDPATIQKPPENFCNWAWADIRNTLVCISSGGTMEGINHKNSALVGCSDWSRPVYFLIERIED